MSIQHKAKQYSNPGNSATAAPLAGAMNQSEKARMDEWLRRRGLIAIDRVDAFMRACGWTPRRNRNRKRKP